MRKCLVVGALLKLAVGDRARAEIGHRSGEDSDISRWEQLIDSCFHLPRRAYAHHLRATSIRKGNRARDKGNLGTALNGSLSNRKAHLAR